jgi:hypothetical protein
VADRHRHFDTKPGQGLDQEIGLLARCPQAALRPLAVAEPWPVKGTDDVVAGSPVHDAAQDPVFGGHDVAVDENDRRTVALPEVVEQHAVHLNEVPNRRVIVLSLSCLVGVVDGRRRQGGSRHSENCSGSR